MSKDNKPGVESISQFQETKTMKKTISEIQKDLQGLLNEVGEDDFARTKALYLKDVQIMDADGNPIDPDSVDLSIEIAPAKDDKMEEDHDDEKAMADEEAEDKAEEDEEAEKSADIDAAVNKAVAKALANKNNTVKGKGFDMRIDNEREGLKRWGSLKHVSRLNCADPELEAYKFGRWAAACMGHQKSAQWCSDRGINTKAHLETVNSQGGFLVPDEFSDTLISLREEYGVIRRNAKIEPMISDTKRIPMRSATLSASFVGEATAGTESTQTFQQVSLVAKKLMVLTSISNELNEDSMINLGDSVAGEIAYAFAKKEDECAFLGDGTSTYGGIVGIANALIGVSSNAGINTLGSSDAAVTAIDLADLHAMMGKLPNYADTPNTKFYMHKTTYASAVEKLMYAAGGTTSAGIYEGTQRKQLFGYDVEFVSAMPTAATADGTSATLALRVPILFGDLGAACSFGDRRSNTISFSDSALNAFEQDEIIVRGTERFDFQVHSPGTSSEAGPLVAIKLD
jgi:HK97 family phage major capsid protein